MNMTKKSGKAHRKHLKTVLNGMITRPTKEDDSRTLELCEEIKNNLESLQNLLDYTVNQGISNKYEGLSKNLINWIEEIEFFITASEL